LLEFKVAVFEDLYVPLISSSEACWESVHDSTELHLHERWKAKPFSGESQLLRSASNPTQLQLNYSTRRYWVRGSAVLSAGQGGMKSSENSHKSHTFATLVVFVEKRVTGD